MSKRIAYLPITSCNNCPHINKMPAYTADNFERPFDWYCGKMKSVDDEQRKIQGYVEWHEEKEIEIPKWCPLVPR